MTSVHIQETDNGTFILNVHTNMNVNKTLGFSTYKEVEQYLATVLNTNNNSITITGNNATGAIANGGGWLTAAPTTVPTSKW